MIVKIFTVQILCIYILIMRYIEEKDANKQLILDSTDENKGLLKRYNDVWGGIGNKIKEVSSGECKYEKDYVKIKFNSDTDLPLNKPLKSRLMIIAIRPVFEEDGKLYALVFLDDTLYKLNVQKCWNTTNLIFQKGLMLIKQIYQKNVSFVTIGF